MLSNELQQKIEDNLGIEQVFPRTSINKQNDNEQLVKNKYFKLYLILNMLPFKELQILKTK